MSSVFHRAYAFNQDLSNWDFSKTTSLWFFAGDSSLSTKNYDKLLKKWYTQLKDINYYYNGVYMKPLTYCKAEAEREYLGKSIEEGGAGWELIDDGKNCAEYNLPPEDILLSNHFVEENKPIGILILS